MTRPVLRLLTLVGTALLALALFTSPAVAAPPGIPSASSALSQLNGLTVASPGSQSGYSRDEFPHWNSTGDGCDVRDEVLIRDGSGISVGANCSVTGSWYSEYDGRTYSSASDIQIDHVVPLAEAWRSGASSWSAAEREAFANDLSGPFLIAVDGGSNSSKSDQPPNEWLPERTAYHCEYARMWVGAKAAYDLTVTSAEASTLRSILNAC